MASRSVPPERRRAGGGEAAAVCNRGSPWGIGYSSGASGTGRTSAGDAMDILDLPGPEFLRRFWGLLAGALVIGVFLRMWMRRPWDEGEGVGDLSPYEVAYL